MLSPTRYRELPMAVKAGKPGRYPLLFFQRPRLAMRQWARRLFILIFWMRKRAGSSSKTPRALISDLKTRAIPPSVFPTPKAGDEAVGAAAVYLDFLDEKTGWLVVKNATSINFRSENQGDTPFCFSNAQGWR